MQRTLDTLILTAADIAVLDENDFGVKGLLAHEIGRASCRERVWIPV